MERPTPQFRSFVQCALEPTTTVATVKSSEHGKQTAAEQFLRDTLWGRQVEEQALVDAYRRVTLEKKEKAELVLITGPSGTGKVRQPQNFSDKFKQSLTVSHVCLS